MPTRQPLFKKLIVSLTKFPDWKTARGGAPVEKSYKERNYEQHYWQAKLTPSDSSIGEARLELEVSPREHGLLVSWIVRFKAGDPIGYHSDTFSFSDSIEDIVSQVHANIKRHTAPLKKALPGGFKPGDQVQVVRSKTFGSRTPCPIVGTKGKVQRNRGDGWVWVTFRPPFKADDGTEWLADPHEPDRYDQTLGLDADMIKKVVRKKNT